jgi:hypothetical protein
MRGTMEMAMPATAQPRIAWVERGLDDAVGQAMPANLKNGDLISIPWAEGAVRQCGDRNERVPSARTTAHIRSRVLTAELRAPC